MTNRIRIFMALIAVGLYFHRRAYKPLVDARKARANEGEPT